MRLILGKKSVEKLGVGVGPIPQARHLARNGTSRDASPALEDAAERGQQFTICENLQGSHQRSTVLAPILR